MDKGLVLGIDIGGSHVTTALVNPASGEVLEESLCKRRVDAQENSEVILEEWCQALGYSLSKANGSSVRGIGVSVPGPFDYDNGVSLIRGVNKYESLYRLNIKEQLQARLAVEKSLPIHFENDAVCFGLGESITGEASRCERVIAITLGTGLGATFLVRNCIQREGKGVPPEGFLYHLPYKEGRADDYFSSRYLVQVYNERTGRGVKEVKEIYDLALQQDGAALETFQAFGRDLAVFLLPWIRDFGAECLVIGGSISKAAVYFMSSMEEVFRQNDVVLTLQVPRSTELSAIAGIASLVYRSNQQEAEPVPAWRKTGQPLLPMHTRALERYPGQYRLYPYTSLGSGSIHSGYASLAEWMTDQKTVLIDGFVGVDFTAIKCYLDRVFRAKNKKVRWYETGAFGRPPEEISVMVAPFLGADESVWGRKAALRLADFFRTAELRAIETDSACDLTIIIGVGASLVSPEAPLVYVDLPKNELQARMRAGSITNLGAQAPEASTSMYKRFYFVDWPVLHQYKQLILDRIEVMVDGQWKDDVTWMKYDALKKGLACISRNALRVRPWFEPGAWGGQWLKNNIHELSKEEVNYAWSFELIVPENGIVFESDGWLLEVAFDWLMLHHSPEVLGRHAARFGHEFPIRFDFLDTIKGGNLSIQCHPRVDYIQEHFGETITQDETYYILESEPGAQVYLGFQEGIDPQVFRADLERSQVENVAVDIEKYIQVFPSHKHDLFLIPNGTVHSSGAGNLVLEISATPYIFTFKMYDWLRLDLNGEPRPINIEHAFNNLCFSRKGARVQEQLIARPYILESGSGWQVVHLPTHPEHFYDIHRVEFADTVTLATENRCHILMLVEGTSLTLTTAGGYTQTYCYAETIVVPAAAGSYTLTNQSGRPVKVIKAFVK